MFRPVRCWLFVLAVLPVVACADVDFDYAPTLTGSIITWEYEGLSGTNSFPDRAEYTNSVASPGTGYSVLWECFRVKGYNAITGRLYTISPEGVFSVSHGWSGGTRTIDFTNLIFSWIGSRTNLENRYGEFLLRLSYRPSSGAYTVVDIGTFRIRHQDVTEGELGTNGNGGNTGTTNNTEDDPVNQTSFWESIFVPSEASIEQLQDAVEDLLSWGPFDLVRNPLFPSPSGYEGGPISEDYKIEFGIGGTLVPGVYEIDGSPFADGIYFVRQIMVALLWFAFLSRAWSAVGRLLGVGGGVVGFGAGLFGGGGDGADGGSGGKHHSRREGLNRAADSARGRRR